MHVPAPDRAIRVDRVDRVCFVVGGLLVLAGLVHLGVFVADNRPWAGPLSWRKPFTFGVSFGLTLWTIAWVASWLRLTARTRTWLLVVLTADCVVEVAGISVQAWRHQPSHLNTTTPANAAIAYTLAIGGAVLVVVLGWLALAALRGCVDGPRDLRLAVQAGFGLLVAGLLAGAAMIARGTVSVRTVSPERGYADAGFLRDFHGVTLHAVLVLPGLAWVLARAGVDEPMRWRVVVATVTAYVAAALLVLALDLA